MACFAILSHVANLVYQLTFPRSSSEVTAENPDLALIKASAQVVQPGPVLWLLSAGCHLSAVGCTPQGTGCAWGTVVVAASPLLYPCPYQHVTVW